MRHLRKFDLMTEYTNISSDCSPIPNMTFVNDSHKIYFETSEDIVPIEYLESTGEQWINTGIIGDLNTEIEIKFNMIETNEFVCGNYDVSSRAISIFAAPTGNQRFGDKKVNINIPINTLHTIISNKNGITINGTTYTRTTTTDFTTADQLYIFKADTSSTTGGKLKVYYFKVRENGKLIADFRPIRKRKYGCMFDTVSKKIFKQQGSTTKCFTLGPDIDLLRLNNIITNGYGTMLNNYNFSSFTFNSVDHPSNTDGSFVCDVKATRYTDEYTPLRSGSILRLKYYVKNSTNCTNYDFIDQYDSDKKQIIYPYWHWIPGTTTYLTQDLNNGDTVVHLANVAPIKASTSSTKGFIIWDYKNSSGYEYPKETYSRRVYTGLWTDNSTDINETNNTITLKSAWNNGFVSAGTYLSHYRVGGYFLYGNVAYTTPVDTWVEKSATFNTDQNNSLCKATAYIRLGWLINYTNTSGNIFKVSGLRLVQEKHI